MRPLVEATEVLQIGPEPTDVAIAVFVSHDRTAPAMRINDIMYGARYAVADTFNDDDREAVLNGTEGRAMRLLHTELEQDRWMTTAVHGPSDEKCQEIMQTMFP